MNYVTFSRRHKRDADHGEIADVLEAFGWAVVDTSKFGEGFPDMVIGRHGITDLVEAKDGECAPWTKAQLEFLKTWRGSPVVRLNSKQHAVEWATRTIRERQHRQQEVRHEPTDRPDHPRGPQVHRG